MGFTVSLCRRRWSGPMLPVVPKLDVSGFQSRAVLGFRTNPRPLLLFGLVVLDYC